MTAKNEKACGCKGIRTCLMCEQNCDKDTKTFKPSEPVVQYVYCHICQLCWSFSEESNSGQCLHTGQSFRLGGISLLPDFVSREEERYLVENIDKEPWLPSQSGRRKQDYGPKVNFKKKKVRMSTFSGFPRFTAKVIERLSKVPELQKFQPVELCNLEYSPERGSAINSHLDDSWLWGNHLVTLNLLSETVLTLTPVESSRCPCLLGECCSNGDPKYSVTDLTKLSESRFSNEDCETYAAVEDSVCTNGKVDSSVCSKELEEDLSAACLSSNETLGFKNCPQSISSHSVYNVDNSCLKSKTLEIQVILPPRSLLLLYDCARYHWYHEIKRQHVTDRRLAMTFRELSIEFLEGGNEWENGKELLNLAKISDIF